MGKEVEEVADDLVFDAWLNTALADSAKRKAFEDFKKALGNKTNKFSEEGLVRMFELQNKLADLFFDNWLRKRNNITT